MQNSESLLFNQFALNSQILKAIEQAGYQKPTPIQAQAIPIVLGGQDLLGIAQTGTGKTAAFALPILELLTRSKAPRLGNRPRSLILSPTRELAIQIHQNIEIYSQFLGLKSAVIFGGVGQGNQVKQIQGGLDILIATPGRLLDLIQQRFLNLQNIEIFVLDEADRMLDMGFIHDIRKILPLLPQKRHSLFFSATLPKVIREMAQNILTDPVKVEITPPASTVDRIDQRVLFVDKKDKLSALIHLLTDRSLQKVILFVGMKHQANRVTEKLISQKISSAAIHGNKSQGARQKALSDFTEGRVRVLVATDIASRGIDVDGVTHVINYDLPHVPDDYVHRIGRTARAGSSGQAISIVSQDDKYNLFAIEKTIRKTLTPLDSHPLHNVEVSKQPAKASPRSLPGDSRPHQKSRSHFGDRKNSRSSHPQRDASNDSPSRRSLSATGGKPTERRFGRNSSRPQGNNSSNGGTKGGSGNRSFSGPARGRSSATY